MSRINWGLQHKSPLILAFGYLKQKLRRESIKDSSKLACETHTHTEEKAADFHQCEKTRELQSPRGPD